MRVKGKQNGLYLPKGLAVAFYNYLYSSITLSSNPKKKKKTYIVLDSFHPKKNKKNAVFFFFLTKKKYQLTK